LIELDAASNTQVDQMRELLEGALYAPARARFKVYIIDEVHMLSRSAFNAMLKTLEEPPEHVKFILATTDPQKVPVTVLSRCLQFNLKQIPVPQIRGQLGHVLGEEGIVSETSAYQLQDLNLSRRQHPAIGTGPKGVVYFGDTARAPYGPRPIAETRQYALECLDRLVDHGVKVLVIACNTASAAVLHDARERYDLPVIEVIRPAVRRAAAATRNRRVGVISTTGTHQSQAYVDAFAAAPQIEVFSQPCPRFVEFVEAGVTGGKELLDVAREYLEPVAGHGVDTVVLGCTHYPLLTGVISYVMGDDVTLVSSAEETAKDVYRVLADGDMLRPDDLPAPTLAFSTTGDPDEFRGLARRFLGPEVETVFGNLGSAPVAVAP